MRESDEYPLGYLITYRSYGTWVPGDERGWVDRRYNKINTPKQPRNEPLARYARESMTHPPVTFSKAARDALRSSLLEVCTHRRWQHHEAAVRTNHVHIVVSAQRDPEFVMDTFKAWGTRTLVDAGLFRKGAKIWERHGSTRYLWSMDDLVGACTYVREMQGGPLD